MKTLKFRAWDGFNGCYYYSTNFSHNSIFFRSIELLNLGENNIIIELFTGLKDKNGVDIYENSVILTPTGRILNVVWNEKFASFTLVQEGFPASHWFAGTWIPEELEVIPDENRKCGTCGKIINASGDSCNHIINPLT